MSSPRTRNISVYQNPKSGVWFAHLTRQEGRSRSPRTHGWDAMDAECARRTRTMRTAKSCGPDAPSLASTVAKVHGSPGRSRISRKAIAQGMSDALRCPVCSCAHSFVHIARETAGAARIRHSLRPLIGEGEEFQEQTSGVSRREIAKLRPTTHLSSPPSAQLRTGAGTQYAAAYPRHCERSEAIHLSTCRGMDCFVASAPRNDGGYDFAISRHDLPELYQKLHALLDSEGAGNAGCALHPRSREQVCTKSAPTSIQGSGEHPTSPAQWLYGLWRALPGERLFCLRSALTTRIVRKER